MNTHSNVRTFRAPDARSALSAVRAALGGEAVILETREVSGGLFGKAQIEVTAAGPAGHPPDVRRAAFEEIPARGIDKYGNNKGGVDSRRRDSGGDLQTEVTALRQVVEQMRRRMPAEGDDDSQPYAGEALRAYKHLLQRGMEDFLARELVDGAVRHGAGGRPGEFDEAVRATLRKQLAPASAPWLGSGRRIIALVGPTGVGKTTAIAKIAARCVLETKFKVGLITVDTYRVGASEQLARYGRIMGIPTQVARDQAGLADRVSRFQDADLILIDTAGRSDNESLAAQTTLLRSVPGVELHLVLSAATGGRELGAIARRYRAIAPERMIFSKIDEVDGPASIYSAAAALPRPISCITDGQRVPEDIHPVTGPELVGIVFGQ